MENFLFEIVKKLTDEFSGKLSNKLQIPETISYLSFNKYFDLIIIARIELVINILKEKNIEISWFSFPLQNLPLIFFEKYISHYLIPIGNYNPWNLISSNSWLNEKWIVKHPDWPWNWGNISSNLGIPLCFIENNPQFPWNYSGIAERKNLSSQFIKNHWSKWNQKDEWKRTNWIDISYYNENIEELMIEYPHWSWDFKIASQNHNVTEKLVEKFINSTWDWEELSEKVNFSDEFLEKHLDKPWEWGIRGFSSNYNLNSSFVEKHLNFPWYWKYLAQFVKLTVPFLRKHFETLNKYTISVNPSLTIKMIEENLDLPWNLETVHYVEDYSLETFEKHPNWPRNWYALTQKFPLSYIETHSEYPWVLSRLVNNRTLTLKFVLNHPEILWNWDDLIRYGNIFFSYLE